MRVRHLVSHLVSARLRPAAKIGALAMFISLVIAGGLAVAQAPVLQRAAGADASDCPDGRCCATGYAIDVSFGLTQPDEDEAPNMICTDACETDATCPIGMGCRQVVEGRGTKQGLCFPRG